MVLGQLIINREDRNLVVTAPHQSYEVQLTNSEVDELIALLKQFKSMQ